jgi:hypothetical protein
MKREVRELPRAEWDFSPLHSASRFDRQIAVVWEYHREAARFAGLDNIPPPFLSRPTVRMPKSALEPVAPNEVPNHVLQEVIAFRVDWRFGIKNILTDFERWLRETHQSNLGRNDNDIASLGQLSVYRLRVIEGLSIREAQSRLRDTLFRVRSQKFFGDKSEQAFSDATRLAKKQIRDLAHVFEKSSESAFFLKGLWDDFSGTKRDAQTTDK